MKTQTTAAAAALEGGLHLPRNHFVQLQDPQGWRIECVSGCAWITQDGDLQDTLLTPGQSHVAQHRTRLLLQALDDSALHIRRGPGRVPTRLVSHQGLLTAATATDRRTL